MEEAVNFIIRNDLSELKLLNHAIRKFLKALNLTNKSIYNISLVIEELVTNTIKYGYEDDKKHEISVDLNIDKKHICIVIKDDGKEFNVLSFPPPEVNVPLKDMRVGGLGIHLVKNLAKSVGYKRENHSNIIDIKLKIHYKEH